MLVSVLFILRESLTAPLELFSSQTRWFPLQKLTLTAARKNCLPDPWESILQRDLDMPFLKYGTQQTIGDVYQLENAFSDS